ncbi:MAG: protein-L-isoaspartate O-methyltransferase [Roseiarcus sp.]
MNDGVDAAERAQFTLRMRARGVQDLGLLRALERAPRALFMPQRYQDVAARDIALPIGGGQTAPPPSVVAAMIAALGLDRTHSVLEIGAGTGYATALLSQLAGRVVAVERRQALALEASARLEAFGVDNAEVTWADGLAPAPDSGRFDRIIVHGLLETPPEGLVERLGADGVLVTARAHDDRTQRIIRLARDGEGRLVAVDCGAARSLMPLTPGLTRGL